LFLFSLDLCSSHACCFFRRGRLVLLPVVAIPAGWLLLVGFRAFVNVSSDAVNYIIHLTHIDELRIVKTFIERNAIQFTKTPSENAVLLAAILIVLVYGIVAITHGQRTTAIIKPASTTVTVEKKRT